MAEPKPFTPVKLVCGLICREDPLFGVAKERLVEAFGPLDYESPAFDFDLTDYYEREMGPGLKRRFLSFRTLVDPAKLAAIKLWTNDLEHRIDGTESSARRINIDPGILSASALIMATAKDFAHRIPLASGIYAHLEFLFTKTDVRFLDWTYPDFRKDGYRAFFLDVRKGYLEQLREMRA